MHVMQSEFMSMVNLKHLCKAGLLSLALLLCLQSTRAENLVAIPALSAHVVDAAQMLPPEQRESLEASLTLYEQTKGTQIAILTVPSTAPEGIEQYGIRVADTWKLGRKGVADGIIILVAKDNPADLHRLRIEVGRGVEGAIPDAIAKRIIDESIVPQFRQQNYYGGLVAGVNRIKSALDGEALPPPKRVQGAPANASVSNWFPLLLFALFFIVLILMRLGGRQVAHLSGNRSITRSQYSNHDILLPAILASILSNSGRGGGGFGGGGGGGFSGGGGDFGGGGASGDW